MKNNLLLSTLLFLLFSTTLLAEVNIYPPNLRAPENGEGGQAPDITIDWDAVTGETLNITYELQLSTNADFSDAVVFDRTQVTAIQMSDLLFGQTYFWRVKAFDDGSPSDWSEVWSFSTASSVTLRNPKIGSEVYADPLIEWLQLTGLTAYQLQIDTTSDFTIGNSGTEATINATFVSVSGDQWAVGENGTVLHFEGAAWVTIDAGTTENLNDVFFVSESDGYTIGNAGLVLHYDGSNWSTVDVGTTNNLNGISFADANMGWIVGDAGITIKYDAGSWSEETTGNSKKLYDIYVLDAANVWACGEGNTVMHFNGTEWMSEAVGTRDLYAIWFVSENDGWVTGKSGKMFHYNGTAWIEEASGTSKDLYAISFDANNIGYAVGKQSGSKGIMVTYNGDWAEMVSGAGDDLYGIYSAGNNTVFGGKAGFLASSNDTGFSSPYTEIFDISSDSIEYRLANLLFGKTFFFRMRAIHAKDTSAWSGAWSTTTYAAPKLSEPTNSSSDTELTQLFKWVKFGGATDYVFEIGADEEFNKSWTVPLDSSSVNFTVSLFGHDYFWRVNALHPQDVSDWSEVWTFKTVNMVSLESPENNAEDVNSCPKFTWEEIMGVPKYELAIDLDENFSNPKTVIVEENSNQCQDAMEKQTIYYWKVRAITGLDSSDWSETWSFKTEGYFGINDNLTQQSVNVFPNPNKGVFSVSISSLKGETYQLSVTDMIGKVLMEKEIVCFPGENKFDLQLENPDNGVYLINVKNSAEFVSKKLFIQ